MGAGQLVVVQSEPLFPAKVCMYRLSYCNMWRIAALVPVLALFGLDAFR